MAGPVSVQDCKRPFDGTVSGDSSRQEEALPALIGETPVLIALFFLGFVVLLVIEMLV